MITPRERELLDRLAERDENLEIHRVELEMQGEELRKTQGLLMGILKAGTDELRQVIEETKKRLTERLKNIKI